MLHDLGILELDRRAHYDKRVAIYDQFAAMGLWSILSCLDGGVLTNLVSYLKLPGMLLVEAKR